MRKIKVLHIITRLCAGGAQEIALSLAKGLDKDIFDVTFACGPQDFSKEMAGKWNIKAVIIPDLIRQINPVKDLAALARLYLFIKKNGFDIVHTHTSKAGVLGRVAAKSAGAPVVFYTPHGSIFHPVYYGPFMRFVLSRVENFAALFTDRIIACSDNEKNDFLERRIASRDKYITIYYGIKQDDFLKDYDRGIIRKEFDIPEDFVLIGNIARLSPEKGHLYCLEAFKMAKDRFAKTKLLIVGDGILKPHIQAKINELDLGEDVIMAGHRDDIKEILAALDISLHTSIWEGLPVAIIEAMLMEKAVIATKVGGVPEMIENGITGILTPSYDKKALTEAIAMLINNRPLAKRLGKAARQSAKERFALETMLRNTTILYNSFIDLKNI